MRFTATLSIRPTPSSHICSLCLRLYSALQIGSPEVLIFNSHLFFGSKPHLRPEGLASRGQSLKEFDDGKRDTSKPEDGQIAAPSVQFLPAVAHYLGLPVGTADCEGAQTQGPFTSLQHGNPPVLRQPRFW